MKHIKKVIAVILAMVMLSAFAVPVVSFAAEATTVANDHTSFEDFWEQMTGEDGQVDWTKLPKVLFKAFFIIRLFEAILSLFRGITGGTAAETTTVAAVA